MRQPTCPREQLDGRQFQLVLVCDRAGSGGKLSERRAAMLRGEPPSAAVWRGATRGWTTDGSGRLDADVSECLRRLNQRTSR